MLRITFTRTYEQGGRDNKSYFWPKELLFWPKIIQAISRLPGGRVEI